jgi:hypothetical protein
LLGEIGDQALSDRIGDGEEDDRYRRLSRPSQRASPGWGNDDGQLDLGNGLSVAGDEREPSLGWGIGTQFPLGCRRLQPR